TTTTVIGRGGGLARGLCRANASGSRLANRRVRLLTSAARARAGLLATTSDTTVARAGLSVRAGLRGCAGLSARTARAWRTCRAWVSASTWFSAACTCTPESGGVVVGLTARAAESSTGDRAVGFEDHEGTTSGVMSGLGDQRRAT